MLPNYKEPLKNCQSSFDKLPNNKEALKNWQRLKILQKWGNYGKSGRTAST